MNKIRERAGSAALFMAIGITGFAVAIAVATAVAREMTVQSSVRTLGSVWSKSILSEYDVHLLDDYGILAFYGNDEMVRKKLETYMEYSMSGKMRTRLQGAEVELGGFEMDIVQNFRRSMKESLITEAGKTMAFEKRIKRPPLEQDPFPGLSGGTFTGGDIPEELDSGRLEDRDGYRYISNPVVLRTLPSRESKDGFKSNSMDRILKNGGFENYSHLPENLACEMIFLRNHLGSHLYAPDNKKSYFRNEWEYVAAGKPSDTENLKIVRRRLFIVRNGANLAYLWSDSEKTQLTMAVAEIISPAAAPAVQLVLMELWAAAEASSDVDDLLNDKRVPVIKTKETWKTSLSGILESRALRGKLDEEALKSLDEHRSEIGEITGKAGGNGSGNISEGLSYEEYLSGMILSLSPETRTLRIMDIVQINMKYRYYKDFNLREYHRGLRFTIKTNGLDQTGEDQYS